VWPFCISAFWSLRVYPTSCLIPDLVLEKMAPLVRTEKLCIISIEMRSATFCIPCFKYRKFSISFIMSTGSFLFRLRIKSRFGECALCDGGTDSGDSSYCFYLASLEVITATTSDTHQKIARSGSSHKLLLVHRQELELFRVMLRTQW
jgi:hypothetical protein